MPEDNKKSSISVKGIPVFGTAEDAANALAQMAKKTFPTPPPKDETKLPYTTPKKQTLPPLPAKPTQKPKSEPVSPPPVEKKRPAIVIAAVLIIVLVLVGLFFISSKAKQQIATPTAKADSDSQAKIKQIAGYDWQNFTAGKFNGKTEEKLAALLLLHEEETTTFQSASYYTRSKKITTGDLKSLNFQKVAEEVTTQNISQLIDNLISSQNLMAAKSITDAKTHVDRLKILKKYFAKYELKDSDKIPSQADTITLDSHPADNQSALMKLLLQRFNIFLNVQKLI